MNITSKTTKAELAEYLTANGIVVEGDEKKDELMEAVKFMTAHRNIPGYLS